MGPRAPPLPRPRSRSGAQPNGAAASCHPTGPCAPLAERPKVGCCRLNLLQPPAERGPSRPGSSKLAPYWPGYTLSQSVSCSVGHGTRICAATAPPRAELDFAPTAREQDRPRSTTAKNVIAEIGSLLEPLWKLEARISPWIRRICAAQAPIRNVATPPSRR